MRARNKPFVSEVHRKKRLAFVQKYSSWTLDEWRRVLWTDEATFRVSDTKGKVWRRKGSDPHDPKFTAKSVKHPTSLMAWGAFSYGGVADLHIFPKAEQRPIAALAPAGKPDPVPKPVSKFEQKPEYRYSRYAILENDESDEYYGKGTAAVMACMEGTFALKTP
ncbi:hypothetical protein O3P69_005296 [Scylla paramamosain]|uniref:Transposase n=1 Tax=Scylla paramamosain TaxID=85552 RepID=A0AAW0U7M1_SCYPA